MSDQEDNQQDNYNDFDEGGDHRQYIEGNQQRLDEDDKPDLDAEDDDGEGQNKQEEETKQEDVHDNMMIYLEKEREIIEWCQENDQKYVDHEFQADNRALFRDINNIPNWGSEVRKITWVRPHEITKDAKFMIDREGDAKQGAFGESWFIGAIIIIATRGDLLDKLFVETQYFEKYGFVTFQFFKNGEWKQVIVDTLLPYDQESKQILFTYCANPSEFWIPLMEKAYCKLHGNYENICDGSLLDGLVDLTGGVSEGWNLHEPETEKLIESNQLWTTMMNYFKQNFYLGCVNYIPEKGTKNADTGTHGILENHHYGICDIREFQREGLKLIRIRNPWGTDGGWNGPFCDDSEEWDKHRSLREELKLVFKSKKSDGTWWMSFQDWHVHFNKLFVCKVFPETWECYSIESKWQGKTQGGVCPERYNYQQLLKQIDQKQDLQQTKQLEQKQDLKQNKQGEKPDYIQLDSDDKWFNNPQFRLKVHKETKMYISLMLEDRKLSKQEYVQCNYMLITSKMKNNRVWERPNQQDIVIEGNPNGQIPAQREITQYVTLKRFEGKNYGYYMIIPNMIGEEKKKDQKRTFYLRIFASDHVDVAEMPETIEKVEEGAWKDGNDGGRRILDPKKGKTNNRWSSNPQYFLNLSTPTHLKIILQKKGNFKKLKNVKIGMTICRFDAPQNKFSQQAIQAKQAQLSPSKKDKQNGSNLVRLLKQTANQLEPPVMEQIERKLQIGYGEKFIETMYINEDVAALYFNWNPTEGPFVIIPSLAEQDKQCQFKLTIFSNNPVELKRLEEKNNAVLVGKWEKDSTDGGCHLYDDPFEKDHSQKTWTQNPKFILKFDEDQNFQQGVIWVKITLAIAEKNWKAKTKDSVGGMIGLYILKRTTGKITLEDSIQEPNFLPISTISEEIQIKTSDLHPNGYLIMPCTYKSKLQGEFIISVTSDREFKFNQV